MSSGSKRSLTRLRQVGFEAARRAEELDRLGSMPVDLFDDLVATGCLQAMVPKANGGLEFSLAEVNELMIEGARANGSLGWILLLTIPVPLVIGLFPPDTVFRLFAEHPRPRARGAIAPKGVAVPADGGYMVSGQWPFASGGPQPDVVVGNCVVMDGGAPGSGRGAYRTWWW